MKKIIIANWKMNPQTVKEAEKIFNLTEKASAKQRTKNLEIVLCPPYIYTYLFSKRKNTANKIKLGAQNCFWENEGAYTGEISVKMLKAANCEYVIIGHSERRINLKEDNEAINKKIKLAVSAGLKAIFCIGEHKRDDELNYFNFLKEEIEKGLNGISQTQLKNIIIAYEPVWAISSSKNAKIVNSKDLNTVIVFIRKMLFNMFKTKNIFDIPILYGGSIDSKDFKNFMEIEEINGFLIGGASVKPEEIKAIFGK